MRVSINCLLIIALLQGCTLEVRKSPEPVETDNSQLENERREQAQWHWGRALELEQQGDFLNAAGERVSYLSYLDQDADVSADTVKIWDNLNRANKNALVRRYRSDPHHADHAG